MSFRGVAFWIMMTVMWLIATPSLVSVIDNANLTGIEGFLIGVLPWAVLLSLIGKVIVEFRGSMA